MWRAGGCRVLRTAGKRCRYGVPPPPAVAVRPLTATPRALRNDQPDSTATTPTPGAGAGLRPRRRKRISELAQERAVPSTRFGRALEFGSLAAGLGVGVARQRLGLGGNAAGASSGPSGLSEENAERIVNTLCRVRGAALKLGQMISIQDDAVLPPQLAKIFDRVRESADYMPETQLMTQLTAQLGPDPLSRVKEFDMIPFAAASIGQVHRVVLHDGRVCAMKVQYPGIAESIDSDIDNLMMLLKSTGLLPKGIYIENVLRVTGIELRQECDYLREAECCRIFNELLDGMPNVSTLNVIPELSTARVFTTEMLEGITLEKVQDLNQRTRDLVAYTILKLTLSELFRFRFVQTDPNWGNFLYDPEAELVQLLDFGATIEYKKEFIEHYIEIIHAAATGDHEKCLEYSIKAGFLSGYEDEAMHRAHVKSVMSLGSPFASEGAFNFGTQDVTREVKSQIPIMLKHREKPPPTETYSLHRKLSGAFLICTRLRANIECREMFQTIYAAYHDGGSDTVGPRLKE